MSVFESASFTSNSSSESMANTPDDLASTMSLLMPDDVNFQSLWLAMQITDTAFPTGALGHSQGLESAFYYDFIHVESEKKSLKRFIELCLEQARNFLIPFVRTGWMIGSNFLKTSFDPVNINSSSSFLESFSRLDEYCHAIHSNEISRRASINQGKGFYRVIINNFSSYSQILNHFFQLNETKTNKKLHYHYSPLFGLLCSLLNLPMEITERMFMRVLLRDLVSAASRLNIIGPMEGTTLQLTFLHPIEKLLTSKSEFIGDDFILKWIPFYENEIPCQSCLIIDFLQSLHDLLYSRLFNS